MTTDQYGPGESDNPGGPPVAAKAGAGRGLDPSEARALSSKVILDLRRSALDGEAEMSDQDRVHAVQLLGQFSDGAAADALVWVLTEARHRLHPQPLARWVRDTALDTLLRSPMQPASAVNTRLARYYSFLANPFRAIRRRSLVYDDVPVLARHGRLGMVVRVYVLPLVAVLLALMLLCHLVFNTPLARSAGNNPLAILVLGALFFISLGLLALNLHQLLLVSLRGLFLRSSPAGRPGRWWVKILAAVVILVVSVPWSVLTALSVLRQAVGFNASSLREAAAVTLVLPMLLVGVYMLAYDLEVARDTYRGSRLAAACAVSLRFLTGFMYIVYVMAAYGMSFFAKYVGPDQGITEWLFRGMFVVGLVAAPLLLLLLLRGARGARRLVARMIRDLGTRGRGAS